MGRAIRKLVLVSVAAVAAVALVQGAGAAPPTSPGRDVGTFEWTKAYDGGWPGPTTGWAGRAGLQAVELRNKLYVMGGRTPQPEFPNNPFGSKLWNDVWESSDFGSSWTKLTTPPAGPSMWAERGYFQAVTKDGAMFVVGGQDFSVAPNPNCQFPPFGPPVCPPFQPPAVPSSTFFNDAWRSADGANWANSSPTALVGKNERPQRDRVQGLDLRAWWKQRR